LLDHIGQEVEGLGVSMRTRASIGIASTELSGGNAVSLIRNADAAMYVSKSLGSGRVTIADQRIVDAADRRLMLEAGLELALDTEEFRLMYQPIVAFGGQLIGFESLLRWTHPALGSIPPPELIAIAEDLDAGHRLTEWCVGRIVADAAAQRDLRGDAAVPLALNVSNKQLEIPGFVELMMATLGAQRLQASSIVLEVTELRPVEAASLAETVLRDCVDAGMQIVLDDFGSGNGSLEYLARIPATFLKLDRKLIGRIANQRVRSVVRCLLASCQETGVTVVAEGIETVEELAAVRDIGVEYGQGYLFAMPDSLGSFGQKSSFLPLAQV
jgi:EAL domain-containing protein (putative c-di-GMP-specific phosphodiesterase class I)